MRYNTKTEHPAPTGTWGLLVLAYRLIRSLDLPLSAVPVLLVVALERERQAVRLLDREDDARLDLNSPAPPFLPASSGDGAKTEPASPGGVCEPGPGPVVSPDEPGDDARVPVYSSRLVRERGVPFSRRHRLDSPEAVGRFLRAYYAEHDREEVVVCLLDTALTLVAISVVSVGGLAASIVEARQVFKVAVLANAAAIIVAHNHPSGNPEPSAEDVRITRRLVEAGELMGIPVRDHLIITDGGYTSLSERGML